MEAPSGTLKTRRPQPSPAPWSPWYCWKRRRCLALPRPRDSDGTLSGRSMGDSAWENHGSWRMGMIIVMGMTKKGWGMMGIIWIINLQKTGIHWFIHHENQKLMLWWITAPIYLMNLGRLSIVGYGMDDRMTIPHSSHLLSVNGHFRYLNWRYCTI